MTSSLGLPAPLPVRQIRRGTSATLCVPAGGTSHQSESAVPATALWRPARQDQACGFVLVS
eukprot:11606856-Alexandrium_andersonii.AAC.1